MIKPDKVIMKINTHIL